jgi:hypothetical protein
MSETNTYYGKLKIKRNIRPSFGDVFFAWVFFGVFRYWTFRFVLPWGIWGAFLHYFLLFSAISLTIRALFTPRYRYEFHRESEPKSDPIDSVSEPPKPEVTSSPKDTTDTEIKPEPPVNDLPEKKIEKAIEKSPEPIVEVKTKPELVKPEVEQKPIDKKEGTEENDRIKEGYQYCSYCGVQNLDYARFCSTCGERLR